MVEGMNAVEKIVYSLGSLYSKYGYKRFKMCKFEEYDTYVSNKDFLISDNVITFTDTNGKLMALKPDVTLSIVKNTSKQPLEYVNKVYYNENVYRVSGGSKVYKEIMQTGLECIGNISEQSIFEVLKLAEKSLLTISPKCILDVSDMGFLNAVLKNSGLDADGISKMLSAFKEKNPTLSLSILNACSVSQTDIDRIMYLISLNEIPSIAVNELKKRFPEDIFKSYLNEMDRILSPLSDGYVKLDFSAINDFRYYNGIVFRGYIDNVPKAVLSGGCYDALMRKMGKNNRAIGFAVYPDELEFFENDKPDADVLLLIDNNTDLKEIEIKTDKIISSGKTVNVQKAIPTSMSFGEIIDIRRN